MSASVLIVASSWTVVNTADGCNRTLDTEDCDTMYLIL
jgi:hypothetical protein